MKGILKLYKQMLEKKLESAWEKLTGQEQAITDELDKL
jgi:hypothetical protein